MNKSIKIGFCPGKRGVSYNKRIDICTVGEFSGNIDILRNGRRGRLSEEAVPEQSPGGHWASHVDIRRKWSTQSICKGREKAAVL